MEECKRPSLLNSKVLKVHRIVNHWGIGLQLGFFALKAEGLPMIVTVVGVWSRRWSRGTIGSGTEPVHVFQDPADWCRLGAFLSEIGTEFSAGKLIITLNLG
jgi:hypothetical protein